MIRVHWQHHDSDAAAWFRLGTPTAGRVVGRASRCGPASVKPRLGSLAPDAACAYGTSAPYHWTLNDSDAAVVAVYRDCRTVPTTVP